MQKWNAEKLSRMFAWLCLAVLVVTTLPLYGISLYNHPYYDDYNFSLNVRRVWKETGNLGDTLAAALDSARNTRQTWQGTYTGTLFSNLQPGLFSEDLYWIANFFLITAMVLGFGFFFCTVFAKLGLGKHDRTSLSCLALTVMIQFMPDVGEAFYWFNGGVGNVFIYSLLAVAIALSVRLICTNGAGIGLTAALAVLAVLLGGGSYGGGLFGLCLTALLVLWLFVKKHRKRWHFAALFALFAGCFLYSMAAPGNTVRAGAINYNSSAVKAVIQSLYYGVAQIGLYIRLPIIAVTLIMLPSLYQAAKRSPFTFRHPWLVLAVGVCVFCTQLTPPLYSGVFIGGGRIVNTYFLSFVVMWFLYAYYLAGFAARRLEKTEHEPPQLTAKQWMTLFMTSLCLLGIGCLGFKRSGDVLYGVQNLSGPSAALSIVTGEAAQYDREMDERERLLNDESQPVVTLRPLSAVPAVLMDDLLREGAEYDVRPVLRRYYGKEAILLEGEAKAQ